MQPQMKQSDEIPKLIHQIYLGTSLPLRFAENVNRIRLLNPTWTHKLYDDSDITKFIFNCYGEAILQSYTSINPSYGVARADLARYLLMYRYGGVYLDLKSSMIKPLDYLLKSDDKFILSQWRNGPGEVHEGFGLWKDLRHVPGGDFQQWYIIAISGHPFLKSVIETVLTNISKYSVVRHGVGQLGVTRITGAIAFTEAIFPMLDQKLSGIRKVPSEIDVGLQYSVFAGLAHTELFQSNYRIRTDPIVMRGGAQDIAAKLFCFCFYVTRKKVKVLLQKAMRFKRVRAI